MNSQDKINDIKLWLESALANQHLTNFSLEVLGMPDKGDNYISDIIFVNVTGQTAENKLKVYNLLLKCNKIGYTFTDVFKNEIHLYSQVLPTFNEFLREKRVDVFNSIAKYYGNCMDNNVEVIVLQNLKALGYKLYDRKKTLTLEHIKLVVSEYGRWHAISAALRDQKPEVFEQLTLGITDMWRKIENIEKLFTTSMVQVRDIIKNDITEDTSQKLKNLTDQVAYVNQELIYDQNHFTVIIHGDCWNNNFMFKYEETDETQPLSVKILDWQLAKHATPVADLSYFLYSCSSGNDLKNLDDILKVYYESFSNHVHQLGSDPDKIFPYSKLLEDWKVFGKFGVAFAMLMIKVVLSGSDEVPDVEDPFVEGRKMKDMFLYEIKDKKTLKERALGIIENAVQRGVI